MRCEACGHSQPDPKPVVVEKKVEVGDNALYARVSFYILIFALFCAVGVTIESCMDKRTLQKAIDTPNVKVEHTDYDSSGRPILKIHR